MTRVVYLLIFIYGAMATRSVTGARPAKVSAAKVRALTEQLYGADGGSVGDQLTLRLQGNTTASSNQDRAPQKLFGNLPAAALRGSTIAALKALLDNYNRDVSRAEAQTAQESREEDNFLDALMATSVMVKTEKFLKEKGFISGSLRPVLQRLWLTTYRRAGALSSSGLEHVFVGEVKGTKVTGFHGWLNFYLQEQKGKLNYYGHMKIKDIGSKIKLLLGKFKWFTQTKSVGSMFIGISPELETALYTVCFFLRPGNNCPVSLNGVRFNIKTFGQTYNGENHIGSAFPNL